MLLFYFELELKREESLTDRWIARQVRILVLFLILFFNILDKTSEVCILNTNEIQRSSEHRSPLPRKPPFQLTHFCYSLR